MHDQRLLVIELLKNSLLLIAEADSPHARYMHELTLGLSLFVDEPL